MKITFIGPENKIAYVQTIIEMLKTRNARMTGLTENDVKLTSRVSLVL